MQNPCQLSVVQARLPHNLAAAASAVALVPHGVSVQGCTTSGLVACRSLAGDAARPAPAVVILEYKRTPIIIERGITVVITDYERTRKITDVIALLLLLLLLLLLHGSVGSHS